MRTRIKAERKPKLIASQFASKVVKKAITRTRGIGVSRENAGKVNKCLACGKEFISKWKLTNHHCVKSKFRTKQMNTDLKSVTSRAKLRQPYRVEKMRIVEMLRCSVCGENFNNATHLKTHFAGHAVHEESKKYICNVCKQTFETSDEWKEHIQQSANASHCDQCGQNFGCVTAKMQHTCIGPTLFACLECKASFKKKWALKRHTLYQHTNFQCTVCKKKLPNRALYREHILTHKQANLANLTRNDKDTSTRHLSSEAERKTRSSDSRKQTRRCNLKFIDDDALIAEPQGWARTSTKTLSKVREDVVTSSKFSTVSNSHKSRTCEYCQKLFRSFKQLKLHRRFKCNTTSQFLKTTTTNTEQENHASRGVKTLNSDLKEAFVTNLFKCGSCPKMYRSEKQLQLHKKVHKLVNLQFSCKKCGRQFWSKSHFADHMQLHERKQLKCDTCSVGTSTLIQFRIHRASHFAKLHVSAKNELKVSATKTVYDCNHCHKLFVSLKDFEDHCNMLNLYAVPSKIIKYNGKRDKNSETSSVESSIEMSDCGVTVMEPTEAAGLPEEAKECRDVTQDPVKTTQENCDSQHLSQKKAEDDIIASSSLNMSASESLLNDPNQHESGLTPKDFFLQKKTLLVGQTETKDIATAYQSESCTLNRSANNINEIFSSPSLDASRNSLAKVAKHSFKMVVNSTRKLANCVSTSDPLNCSTGDTECNSTIGHNLVQSSVSDSCNLEAPCQQLEKYNSWSSRSRHGSRTLNQEKQCKYSPIARTLVALFVKQLLREGISEASPHVCGFCGRVFCKPQGINNHYLMKHTLQEIENLPTSPVNQYKEILTTSKVEDVATDEFTAINIVNASLKTDETDCSTFSGSATSKRDDVMGSERSSETVNMREGLENITEKPFQQHVASSKKRITPECDSLSFDKSCQQVCLLSELRFNFSKLFCHLVGDKEVLCDLGWPQRQIDEVLSDVITRCDLKPYCDNCELTSLRENISILLKICIKEQAMDNFGWNKKLVDVVVKEMLAGGDIVPENLETV